MSLHDLIPAADVGDAIVYALIVIGVVAKWVSDKVTKKAENEAEEPDDDNQLEIITKGDLARLEVEIEKANRIANNAIGHTQDLLACTAMIQILYRAIATDRRRSLYTLAKGDVDTFMLHAEFPSRSVILSMLEIIGKEITDKEYVELEKERINSSGITRLDPGSDN